MLSAAGLTLGLPKAGRATPAAVEQTAANKFIDASSDPAALLSEVLHPHTPSPPASRLDMAVNAFDDGNLPVATQAFRSLAAKGDPQAAYWYGHAQELGLGVPVNIPQALQD